jgi:hypothetical protein
MIRATTDRSHDRRNYVGPSRARLSSALPDDAHAVIERAPRAAAGRRGWRLRLERRRPYGVDPLTGWTTSADPLTQIGLRFPDLASAIRYAERHDLAYDIREDASERRRIGGRQSFQEAPSRLCCWPTGPHPLCCGDYPLPKETRAS